MAIKIPSLGKLFLDNSIVAKTRPIKSSVRLLTTLESEFCEFMEEKGVDDKMIAEIMSAMRTTQWQSAHTKNLK